MDEISSLEIKKDERNKYDQFFEFSNNIQQQNQLVKQMYAENSDQMKNNNLFS